MVEVRDDRVPTPCSAEDSPPYQDDAVSRIGLFGPLRLDVRAATVIHDGDVGRFEEQAPCLV
jgi:hypothetical protein